MSRILASPLPSTVSSSSGRMRGDRSTEITEQPAVSSATSTSEAIACGQYTRHVGAAPANRSA